MEESVMTYRNRPLARSGDMLYYGYPDAKCCVLMNIVSKKSTNGLDVADSVIIQLLINDRTLRPAERIKKQAKQFGLAKALEIADLWLTGEEK